MATGTLVLFALAGLAAPGLEPPPESDSDPPSASDSDSDSASDSDSDSDSASDSDSDSASDSASDSDSDSDSASDSNPARERGPMVHIEVRGPMAVRLHRFGPGPRGEIDGSVRGLPFSTVCHSPCDQQVAVLDRVFLVAAPELMPSPDFTLDDYDRAVTITVKPGLRSVRFAGFGVTVAGAVLVPLGVLVLAAAGDRTGGVAAGGTMIGVGGASLATGIGLLLAGRTRVDIDGE